VDGPVHYRTGRTDVVFPLRAEHSVDFGSTRLRRDTTVRTHHTIQDVCRRCGMGSRRWAATTATPGRVPRCAARHDVLPPTVPFGRTFTQMRAWFRLNDLPVRCSDCSFCSLPHLPHRLATEHLPPPVRPRLNVYPHHRLGSRTVISWTWFHRTVR